jgi:polyribonucleotide nucleotidyltransferase
MTEATINGASITIETGKWAKQAHGSIVYRTGNLVLLATVCAEKEAREGQDFFPLTVDYREKFYSVGRVPGGYIKRENRPAEHETLLSRIIDRPIRPLFPQGYFSEVQLLVTVLSSDTNTRTESHAITAASAALCVSDIPFDGPIAGVVVGRIDGKLVADPTIEEMKNSDLELIVAGSSDAIAMIEGEAQEISKEEMLEALTFAHDVIKEKVSFQEDLVKKIGVQKREVSLRLPDEELMKKVREYAFENLKSASSNTDKTKRSENVDAVYKETAEHFKEQLKDEPGLDQSLRDIKNYLHELEAEVVRDSIFHQNLRADGRDPEEIRDISVELDVLPGVHGSAVFTRGQTQSLGVVTLGTGDDYQRFENLSGQQQKNFMLHYNFPPFSTGEVKRMMGPGRREIGHGNLAERALKAVVPKQSDFPYVIRVVSEILESNGSSSMASVCSGSLAMMTAGVPVKQAVSGIAMGLITNEGGDYKILSDIAGIEDHFGDMDFKVAGTKEGITAFQLDIKIKGLTIEIMRNALEQAERGRMHILEKMNAAIENARENVSDIAPRISTIQIDPDRIGELIGPGGKVIRAIIERSGADVNVEDNGVVTIASANGSANDVARQLITDLFADLEVGKVYDGVVKRVADFGAIVEIVPGREGLLHVSKMSTERVNDVHEFVNDGDRLQVMVIDVDHQGRVSLAHKDFDISSVSMRGPRSGPPRGDRRGGDRRGGSGNDRRGDERRGGPRR